MYIYVNVLISLYFGCVGTPKLFSHIDLEKSRTLRSSVAGDKNRSTSPHTTCSTWRIKYSDRHV